MNFGRLLGHYLMVQEAEKRRQGAEQSGLWLMRRDWGRSCRFVENFKLMAITDVPLS